ncbi:MAG: acyl-CoA dehydrogenase family protein [Candidatus Dormibacteria bacterium]
MFIGRTAEQQQLRESVRALLSRTSSESEVRRVMATPDGHDPAAWERLLALGLLGIVVPEELGGGGASLVDQGVVLEEMGRSAMCGPYVSTAVLAVQALLHLDRDAAVEDLLRRASTGTVMTLALGDAAHDWTDATVGVRAEQTADGWRLDGSVTHVPDGTAAEVILVLAGSARALRLFAVDAAAPGLERTPLPTMDQTRKQARLDLTRTPAQPLGGTADVWPALLTALQVCAVALAVEQVGGAQFVLERVVAYASTRHQFGRPVGSFQAVQHRCASMLVEIEAARSAAYYGLRVAAERSAELPAVASLARSFCSTAYRHATDDAIQLFGGVGITWDHPIHIYFKRARSSELALGTPAQHREILARQLAL